MDRPSSLSYCRTVSLADRLQYTARLFLRHCVCVCSAVASRNWKLDLQYLLTRPANGWTCRDVPMTMRRSQRGKSWQWSKEDKSLCLQRCCITVSHACVQATTACVQTAALCSPFSLKWRTGQEDSLQRRRYLGEDKQQKQRWPK